GGRAHAPSGLRRRDGARRRDARRDRRIPVAVPACRWRRHRLEGPARRRAPRCEKSVRGDRRRDRADHADLGARPRNDPAGQIARRDPEAARDANALPPFSSGGQAPPVVIVPSLGVRGSHVSTDPGRCLLARVRALVAEGAEAAQRVALAPARAAQIAGVRALYLIDVTTEGLLAGPPLALVAAVRAVVGRGVALLAGGGVRDLDDIRALALRGVASVVIGRALAENRFTIRAARQASAA